MTPIRTCLASILVAFSFACGGGGGGGNSTGPDPRDAIASVSVSPASTVVDIGSSVALTATVRNGHGAPVTTTVTWSSSDNATATVAATGTVTGVSAGAVTITATAGGKSGTASVSVNDPFPPSAPSGLTAQVVSHEAVQLNWTDNSDNEDEFRIEREQTAPLGPGETSGPQRVFGLIQTLGPNTTSFLDQTVEPETSYRYRATSCNQNGCSEASAETPAVTTPAAPTGTITIQKAIQSSTGGAPDNPPNPGLAGFEFQIKLPNTQTVVETITTDGTGQAQASVPVGTYDVTESNSLGLNDQTLLVEDLTVTEGADSPITWVNRQDPVPMGTLSIQKVIQSNTGGVPDNPANPSLAGFVFDIRVANTAPVVGSITTDANGQGQITLPVGAYDVTERVTQGLIDFTGPLNGQAVLQDQDTNLQWVNRQTGDLIGHVAAPGFGPRRLEARDPESPFSVASSIDVATQILIAGGAMANGNYLTFEFTALGGSLLERHATTGAVVRTFDPAVVSAKVGPDPCSDTACLIRRTIGPTLEIWRIDPFTGALTYVLPGDEPTVFDGPNGETQIFFDAAGALYKREPAISGAAIPLNGLAQGGTYAEPSVCPSGNTILFTETPATPDIVAYDLDLAARTVSNRRVLTNDGTSRFPVCWDDQGANIVFFFESRANLLIEVRKGQADGTIVPVAADPNTSFYGPFPIRR